MSGTGYTLIKEGAATVKCPAGKVFYNPVQQFNRDLSVLAIEVFSKGYLSNRKKQHLKVLSTDLYL